MRESVCTVCGISYPVKSVRHKQLYCSERCRSRYRKKTTGWESFTPGETRTCARDECEKTFCANDRRQILCSPNCALIEHRKRKAAGLAQTRTDLIEAHRRKREAAEDRQWLEAQRKSQAAFNRMMGIKIPPPIGESS